LREEEVVAHITGVYYLGVYEAEMKDTKDSIKRRNIHQ
jgi:hypothetical protein